MPPLLLKIADAEGGIRVDARCADCGAQVVDRFIAIGTPDELIDAAGEVDGLRSADHRCVTGDDARLAALESEWGGRNRALADDVAEATAELLMRERETVEPAFVEGAHS